MTTLSARVWRANRSFGRALVFWLWLWSFVFSFAASDCFHSATCPEQALLKWAGHSGHACASVYSGTFHLAGADIECASCALVSVALAIVAVSAQVLVLLCFALLARPLTRLNPGFLPALPIARGPPVLA